MRNRGFVRKEVNKELPEDERLKKIEELSGINVFKCYQCGKCSAGCPIADLMDVLPNQAIRYVQLGLIDELLEKNTVWLCASCFTCAVRCPQGIDLAKLFEAVRQLTLRKNIDHVKVESRDMPVIALVSCYRKFTA